MIMARKVREKVLPYCIQNLKICIKVSSKCLNIDTFFCYCYSILNRVNDMPELRICVYTYLKCVYTMHSLNSYLKSNIGSYGQ